MSYIYRNTLDRELIPCVLGSNAYGSPFFYPSASAPDKNISAKQLRHKNKLTIEVDSKLELCISEKYPTELI